LGRRWTTINVDKSDVVQTPTPSGAVGGVDHGDPGHHIEAVADVPVQITPPVVWELVKVVMLIA
jgi:hypothetical protein